jgi:hypothetical protein
MSNTYDQATNADTLVHRGKRGGRVPRGRSRGRSFHFIINAQMALIQYLMRRGRIIQPAATDAISLPIGNFCDAPLNARKLDKSVYPSPADRNNILKTYPIYLCNPSSRQDL